MILAQGWRGHRPDSGRPCRAAFGAGVTEFYSSKEAGAIASRCPSGDGYHVNAEAMLFEVVDDQGQPVPPGRSGAPWSRRSRRRPCR